jgi:hypothetical protein
MLNRQKQMGNKKNALESVETNAVRQDSKKHQLPLKSWASPQIRLKNKNAKQTRTIAPDAVAVLQQTTLWSGGGLYS